MDLKPGTRVGPYEIASQLGAGGMGVVYRARDTKLNRDVALKVLPDLFANDAERLARFQREAQVLASLNHPNIGAIYGLEEADGVRALVLELVEGPTLADRIAEGPLAVDQTLPIAHQIAEALDAAHDRGIVHRDLKPANVKVRADGTVKVLDFGLAKPWQGDREADLSQSPTLTTPAATRAGVIMGTAAYMPPEQAAGQPVDKRSDIWAFGVVLFEMLSGRRVFAGDTVAQVLVRVLEREPDFNLLPANTPPKIRELLRRCLQKDPKRRLRDIGEALIQIEEAATASAAEPAVGVPVATHLGRPRRAVPLVFAGLIAALVVGTGIGSWLLTPDPPRHITRFALTLPEGEQFTNLGRHLVALSPDGTHLAYVANNRLNLRAMDQLEATPIRGTEGPGGNASGRSPFFSPDGQWIGFWQAGQLRKVSVTGGAPVTLCDAENPWGASWGADDTILFGQGPQGVWRVSGQGGAPEMLIAVDASKDESAHRPQMLPGAEAVLFTLASGTTWDDARIVVQSLETGERKGLVEGGRDGRYVPTGHLIYARQGTLLALPFDLSRLEVTGGPVSLVEGVQDAGVNTGAAHFSLSDDGALVYVPGAGGGAAERTLVWVDRNGREEPVPAPPRPYSWVRVSPDGTRLAMEVEDPGNTDVWIYDLARRTSTRLTSAAGLDRFPIWTPDGRPIVYTSGSDIVWKAADGTGDVERLATGLSAPRPFAWSGDGKTLVFDQGGPGNDLAILPIDGERRPQPLIANQFTTARPAVSPDGRWVAYQSNESGSAQIYVQPFPEVTSGRWLISTEGGQSPIWSPEGRELFYNNGNALLRVRVNVGASFNPGTPEALFQGTYFWAVAGRGGGAIGRPFDITPDGQRFLMVKQGAAATPGGAPRAEIIVVQNWLEELKGRVPTP